MTLPDNIKEEIEKVAKELYATEHQGNPQGAYFRICHKLATQFYERGRISDETAKYWWDNYPKGLQCLLSPTEVVSANEYVKRENEAIKKEKIKIAKASFEAALAIETTMIRENWEHREHKFKNVQNYIDSDEFKKLLETPNDSEG